MVRILGIDPGANVCGFGVIDVEGASVKLVDFGVVRSPRRSQAEKLKAIYERLLEVMERFKPHVVAVEGAFYGSNPRTAIRMGEGRGIALLAVSQCGLEAFEYSPATVKRAVVGSGRASKSQVQHMVRDILGLDEVPRPDDAADALAIAICHSHRMRGGAAISSCAGT